MRSQQNSKGNYIMYRDYMNTVYMKNRIYGYSINKK